MFCALRISTFQNKTDVFVDSKIHLFLLYDLIIASTAYHHSPGPAKTGIAILLTTLHVNMMFLQHDCTQLLFCQQTFLSKLEPVAYTSLQTFERQLRIVSMQHDRIT